jgi:hypothetical protein
MKSQRGRKPNIRLAARPIALLRPKMKQRLGERATQFHDIGPGVATRLVFMHLNGSRTSQLAQASVQIGSKFHDSTYRQYIE